jgi:hypothetical protein
MCALFELPGWGSNKRPKNKWLVVLGSWFVVRSYFHVISVSRGQNQNFVEPSILVPRNSLSWLLASEFRGVKASYFIHLILYAGHQKRVIVQSS